MKKNLDSPWAFDNEYLSPNKKIRIKYSNIHEVAMGAPLTGQCSLFIKKRNYAIRGSLGGPPVWEKKSQKVAIPYWRFPTQRLAVIDIETMTMIVYERILRVIQLEKFQGNIVYIKDSPIYNSEKIKIDITREKIARRIRLG